MIPRCAIFWCLLLMNMLFTSLASEEQPDQAVDRGHGAKVKTMITTMIESFWAGQIGLVLDHTHPKIIAMMGGKAAAEKTLTESMEEALASGIKFKSFVIDPEPVFHQGKAHLYVIVESTLVLTFSDQRMASRAFRIGMLVDGVWSFAEGSGLTPAMMTELFPDFPVGVKLPEVSQKILSDP